MRPGERAREQWQRGHENGKVGAVLPYPLSLLPSAQAQAQLSAEPELHYASLQRLPVQSGKGTDLDHGEEKSIKEDPNADYACIAKSKPT